jgi:uncharacterized protein (UPF0332 family)
MSLKEKERKDLVKYRLEKARNIFAEVPVLIENQFYGTAMNRLYYVCFYAATALLVNDSYETHTHSGVKTVLGLHFIKENKLDKSFAKMYDQLFNLRQRGDYEDWVYINEVDILPYMEPVEKFIAEIENLINNSNLNQ